MSDAITHECGIALVRLKKPLSYFHQKYGSALYGINKMYILMEKQHNRGQDGAGLANIKLDMPPGKRYISRYRSIDKTPIQDLFERINQRVFDGLEGDESKINNPEWLKQNVPFIGELYLGHLRYGTYGGQSIENIHPFLRQNNWLTRNLILAGNFNMTNVDQLFDQLVEIGQHPKEKADTVTILEKIGHFLDEQNEKLYRRYKKQGLSKADISPRIAEELDIQKILKKSAKYWDGGYAMAGLFGHGDAFVLRDPNGIRPAFYYDDDEVCVVASERPVIQTAFDVPFSEIKEITPGNALVIKKNGEASLKQIRKPGERTSCSFERIYFSRGNDADIYRERIELGRKVCPAILDEVDHDLRNTVFSFIPNTAEISFYGMVKGMEDYLNQVKRDKILKFEGDLDSDKLESLLSIRPRVEKSLWKDVKMRTFITQDTSRDELVSHVYDITYETVKPKDNLVVIDDSIVRGTTLKKSILSILDRLGPKRIVVVSSAPQIRYPDCYGINMSLLEDFAAFRAAIALLKERNMEHIIKDTYEKCSAQKDLPDGEVKNYVKNIYAPFDAQEISDKIAEMLTPKGMKAEVKILFQSIENLHASAPNHTGDWYFTGNFPTPGGHRVVNKAFLNYYEGKRERAY